jgi:hypothetical protein
MTIEAAEKFAGCVEKIGNDSRYVEYIKNSPDFPGMFMHYGNSNTTDYDLLNNRNRKNHGIVVNIQYINKPLKNKIQTTSIKFVMAIWKIVTFKKLDRTGWKVRLCWGLGNVTRCVIGKQRFANMYYKFLKNAYNVDDFSKCEIVKIARKKIPSKMFINSEKLNIDGYEFPVPSPLEEYFKASYKFDYKNFSKQIEKVPSSRIISSKIPFSEVIGELKRDGLDEEIWKESDDIVKTRNKVSAQQNVINRNWKQVVKVKQKIAYQAIAEDESENEEE